VERKGGLEGGDRRWSLAWRIHQFPFYVVAQPSPFRSLWTSLLFFHICLCLTPRNRCLRKIMPAPSLPGTFMACLLQRTSSSFAVDAYASRYLTNMVLVTCSLSNMHHCGKPAYCLPWRLCVAARISLLCCLEHSFWRQVKDAGVLMRRVGTRRCAWLPCYHCLPPPCALFSSPKGL